MEEQDKVEEPAKSSEETPQNQEKPANKESISLGGNITLNGFQDIENAKMIVLKKMIGNHAREIQDKKSDYEKLIVTLEGDENNATIKLDVTCGGNSTTSEETSNNLFTSAANALKKLVEQI